MRALAADRFNGKLIAATRNINTFIAVCCMVFFTGVFVPETEAATINACVDANGRLRIIPPNYSPACLKGEYQLSWNQEGPQGPAGPPGPQGPPGPKGEPGATGDVILGGIQVFDATNAPVGSLRGQDALLMALGGIPLVFNNFTRAGFTPAGSDEIAFYYKSSNCYGQRYLPAEPMPRTAHVDATLTAFYANNPIKPESLASYETFAASQSLTGAGTCHSIIPAQTYPVGPVAIAPLPLFAPPFSFRPSPGQ